MHKVDREIRDYLMDKHDCEQVRMISDPDYEGEGVECYGQMPNSIEEGWFFAGYVSDIKKEMQQKDEV